MYLTKSKYQYGQQGNLTNLDSRWKLFDNLVNLTGLKLDYNENKNFQPETFRP